MVLEISCITGLAKVICGLQFHTCNWTGDQQSTVRVMNIKSNQIKVVNRRTKPAAHESAQGNYGSLQAREQCLFVVYSTLI